MARSKKKIGTKKTDLVTRAARGKEEILQLQEDMAPGPGLESAMRKSMAIWTRLPLAALVTAVALHEKYGAKVGDFDSAGVREAVEYEQAVTPLLDAAKALVRRLEDATIERRTRIGKQPLGLLMSLRGAVRYGSDPGVQRDLDELEKLIVKKRRPRSKADAPAVLPPAPAVTRATPLPTAPNVAHPSVSTPSVDVTVHSAS